MIYPLLPIFLTSTLGATPLIVGMIEGGADAIASILKYFAGTLSDRMAKRKPLVVTGYAIAAAARALIAIAAHWPLVLAARLIDRTGKGIRSAPRDAIIADVTPPADRGRAFGFHRALDHSGAIVGPLIAFCLLQGLHLSLRTTFLIAVIPGSIGALLVFLMLHEEPRVVPSSATGEGLPSPGPMSRRFWGAIGAIGLFSLANSSDAYLILQASAAGVSTAMLPLLWAAHHVIKSLFSTRAGALSDRIDRRFLLIAGWASYAVIYFIFPYARSLTFFAVLFVLYAIPFTLSEGAERAWVSGFVDPQMRGKAFGIYYLVNGAGVLAGTALFGLLYQNVSHESAFVAGALLALAAAVVVALNPASERAATAG